jgi:hypothetical protein
MILLYIASEVVNDDLRSFSLALCALARPQELFSSSECISTCCLCLLSRLFVMQSENDLIIHELFIMIIVCMLLFVY